MSKKKHHDHEEHEEHVNHEAWVIPYADMLTLLMALFLVLFAIGRVDTEKFKALAESLHQEITGASSSKSKIPISAGGGEGTQSVLNGLDVVVPTIVPDTTVPGQQQTTEQALQDLQDQREHVAATIKDLGGVQVRVEQAAVAQGVADKLEFKMEGRGLVVTIVTDQVMFASGKAELQSGGGAILDIIGKALKDTKYNIQIEGHTDSRPISNAKYASNWELSTARATNVLRYLVDHDGLSSTRLSAAGYADTHPVSTGTSDADLAKNRRVEIVILSDVILTSTTGG